MRRRRGRAVGWSGLRLVATLALLATPLLCATAERDAKGQSWSDGRRAHMAGRYAQAIDNYEALVAAGMRHEALFYNLGNAYFRTGRYGPAIFNFERALRVAPALADARTNLGVARAAATEQQDGRILAAESTRPHALARGRAESLLLRGAEVSSLRGVSVAFLALNVVFFLGLVAVRILRRGFLHAIVIVANVFSGIGVVVSAVLLVAHIHYASLSIGIVLPREAVLHVAPSVEAAAQGPAYAGLRVRLLARDSGWVSVRLADGREGWIAAKAIGVLR